MTTVNRRSQRKLQNETIFPRKSSLFTAAASVPTPPHSSITSNLFSSLALFPFLGTQRPHQLSLPIRFFFYHYCKATDKTALSLSVIYAASEIRFDKRSLLIPALSSSIQPSQFASRDEVLRNDDLPQQPFLQSDEPFTSNEPCLQQFPGRAISAFRSNSELRFPLLFPCWNFLSEQNITIAKILQRSPHRLVSHTPDSSFLSKNRLKIHLAIHRQEKKSKHQWTSDINSTKLRRAEKHFKPNTREKHSTDFERFQQRSACKEVAVSSTLKIPGHKNRYNPSSMLLSALLSFVKKKTTKCTERFHAWKNSCRCVHFWRVY